MHETFNGAAVCHPYIGGVVRLEAITSTMLAPESLAAELADSLDQVNVWLERGDGIAVYENQELGHPDLGMRQYLSYGSPTAQLETDEPPTRLPDIGGRINWRYQLVGTYRGASL